MRFGKKIARGEGTRDEVRGERTRMDAAVAGLIGAFGGAGVGFLGALKINADQRREAQRIERRRAFAATSGRSTPPSQNCVKCHRTKNQMP